MSPVVNNEDVLDYFVFDATVYAGILQELQGIANASTVI